jgi:hypothetical protein
MEKDGKGLLRAKGAQESHTSVFSVPSVFYLPFPASPPRRLPVHFIFGSSRK